MKFGSEVANTKQKSQDAVDPFTLIKEVFEE
jgi:hypothetical protein